ncbi:MAG: hypothetical protein ACD_39C01250G0002 [uncultured bacterium]|nr:MAG: hypothetical protein ACD_39C01250G0002 [uncultured bacterium]
MYVSKFLLNRQKIVNPPDIKLAIASYFTGQTAEPDFFYRLEWYKIGISIPFTVYSATAPVMKLMPECQLLETAALGALENQKYQDFALFAAPPFDREWDPCTDEKKIIAWLKKELAGAAVILNHRLGPNNRIYYEVDGEHRQQQTVTISGTLQVENLSILDQLRQKPLGNCTELGCGLLQLVARCEYADKVCCRL